MAEVELTERQKEALELFARGYTTEEAAEAMGVSPRTVKAYSDLLRVKFGVRHRRQLIPIYWAFKR